MCAARPGARWRIVVAQVRRKFMMARWLQSRCDVSPIRAVADNTLTDKQMMVLPVRISGQVKPLIRSVPRYYPPPRMCLGCDTHRGDAYAAGAHVGEGVSALCPAKGAFRRPKGSATTFCP